MDGGVECGEFGFALLQFFKRQCALLGHVVKKIL